MADRDAWQKRVSGSRESVLSAHLEYDDDDDDEDDDESLYVVVCG